MNWMNVLKSNQINVGSTTLDTRALPEEEEGNECWAKLKQMKEDWESATTLMISNIELSKFSESLNQELIPPEEVACWVIDEYKKFNLDENIFTPGGYFAEYLLNGEEWTLWIGNDSMLNRNMRAADWASRPFFKSSLRNNKAKKYFAIGSEINWYGGYPEGHTKEDKVDLIWYRLLTEHMYGLQSSHDFSNTAHHYGDPEPEDIVKLFQIHLDWRKYLR
jgi:hypothetical protein